MSDTERLWELVDKWKRESDNPDLAQMARHAKFDCAKELEEALNEQYGDADT